MKFLKKDNKPVQEVLGTISRPCTRAVVARLVDQKEAGVSQSKKSKTPRAGGETEDHLAEPDEVELDVTKPRPTKAKRV